MRPRDLGKTTDSGRASVWVIDPDPAARSVVQELLVRHSFNVEVFESSRQFFARYQGGSAACLVLEQQLPDGNGLAIQKELSSAGDLLPMVFLTASGDVPTAVAALKGGAADFLLKPMSPSDLITAVQTAVERAKRYRVLHAASTVSRRLQALTVREREVLDLVVAGLSTKQISAQLGRVDKTVEFHRQNIMKKLGASNVAQLVRLVTTADHAMNQRNGNGYTARRSQLGYGNGGRM